MATIYIDNKPYEVKDGQNLLNACLSLGFNIPYFCWHPAMHSVGACRQCAVKQFKDENDTRGRIVMSCMTPATDGARISIDDPDARKFRASIIEWLMINHPHDCPVCDEGGECHLQDMTVMAGHVYRRYRFKKRTHRNQYLGPLVNHEMNRCIQCYRCVRFYRDYAGGRDFNVFACHDHVYFGRHKGGVLENQFSGNLVEVCPTGVFTDKTLKKHYTRKWDLQSAPSVCVHCGLGCNTIPGERYGKLRRILNRYNSEVNGYFLCDRGRFGYEFVNSDKRIKQIFIRPGKKSDAVPASKENALKHMTDAIHFGANVIGIGSPRASLEANFALRSLIGPENFYSGMSGKEHGLVSTIISILRKGPARAPSLHDVRNADAVLVLGEDVLNTAPMLALSLRQAVKQRSLDIAKKLRIPEWHNDAVRNAAQNERSPLFIATPCSTGIDDIAEQTYRAAPDDLARLGFAVAHELDPALPQVTELNTDTLLLVKSIARALSEAKRPVIVSGIGCVSETVIHAAANIAWALCEKDINAQLCYTVPDCNSMGLGLMDAKKINEAFSAVRAGDADAVIVLENDLYRRFDAELLDSFFKKVKHIIAIDHTFTKTTAMADLIFPACTFAESTGTIVNNEGRAQRFYQVLKPGSDIQASWRWLREVMISSGETFAEKWQGFDDVTNAMIDALPVFNSVRELTPPSSYRVHGMKIPRQPHRYSGRTAILANVNVHEPELPDDPDSPLSFSMEGHEGQPQSSLISRFWSPGWNSVQSVNKFQEEIAGPLRGGDPGKRLIEPQLQSGRPDYFYDLPGAFILHHGEWLIVPLYHIFGSEELSAISGGILELVPKLYLGLNPEDLRSIGKKEGETIELNLLNRKYDLSVKAMPYLPRGIAGLPYGLPGLHGIELPAWGKLK
ncbi:MAG: NADH-quinone oxidoreductase subunit NuoG [Nitrospirae bacterium]|nr:NADH-quinone oxidoreductase subunit NuoG [Nitrospirota bacterium]